jgi:hypothetical protein
MAAQKAAGLMAEGTRGNIQEVVGRSGGFKNNPPVNEPNDEPPEPPQPLAIDLG